MFWVPPLCYEIIVKFNYNLLWLNILACLGALVYIFYEYINPGRRPIFYVASLIGIYIFLPTVITIMNLFNGENIVPMNI